MKGLIAIPHMGNIPVQFMQNFCHLMTKFHEIDNPHAMWVGYHWTHIAREKAAKKMMEDGYDWLMFLDSDMTFPPDIIKRLLDHNKPIVTALAFKREWPTRPVIYKSLDDNMDRLTNLTTWDKLQEIDASGCACVLIRREVFEKIESPYFALNEWGAAEDISFFVRVKRAGIKVYCDTTMRIGHVGQYEFTIDDYKSAIELGLLGKDDIQMLDSKDESQKGVV